MMAQPIPNEIIIADFNIEKHLDWMVVNDDVMGGISESNIQILETNQGLFSGELSLENNGGFASCRTLVGETDFSTIDTIKIKVKGDGNIYKLRIRNSEYFDGVSYSVDFETTKDEWTIFKFKLTDFVPVYRGRILENEGPLEADQIKQVGFLISDKQAGAFELHIDWIVGVGEVEKSR